jgi:methionyl-tRNA synthetase
VRKASQILMEMAHLCNAYFDEQKPWADKEHASNTIATALHMAKVLAVVCNPILPHTSERIWHMLHLEPLQSWEEGLKALFTKNLRPAEILFPKMEDAQIEEEIKKLSGSASPFKAPIGIDEFDKVDLRVGQVIAAEKLPKSKKLLKLQVDLGFEKRQILSGIALHISPESLIGKKVVIVANLKPAKLMGEESQGMLLCISNEDRLEVLSGGDLPCGSSIQ